LYSLYMAYIIGLHKNVMISGETLIELHANDELRLKQAVHHIEKCLTIEQKAEKPTLIYNTVC